MRQQPGNASGYLVFAAAAILLIGRADSPRVGPLLAMVSGPREPADVICRSVTVGSLVEQVNSAARLHDKRRAVPAARRKARAYMHRSEEHTSELQSQSNLVCRLLLEKKKNKRLTYSLPLL